MKIKICGITNLTDANYAVSCGADLLGFIFYKKSLRYVSPTTVKDIIANFPKGLMTVGVFVNESDEFMLETAKFCGLRIIQLHGHKPLSQTKQLNDFEIFKAISITHESDLESLDSFPDYTLLIDTPGKNFGGSGVTGNWELAAKICRVRKAFLAGGLTPFNVAHAIRSVRPFGVDVSSGVEREKGIKDPDKVKEFILAARGAE